MAILPKLLNDIVEPVIWVDGGVNHRINFNQTNSNFANTKIGFAVGDGDSCHTKLDQYLNSDKDYSDLAFVFRALSNRDFTEINLLGFLGGRCDHQLFNLGETHHFLTTVKNPTQVNFDNLVYAYSAGQWRFSIHGEFSLIVLERTKVELTGRCKFSIHPPRELIPLTSYTLSNSGSGRIKLVTDGPAFILLVK